MGIRKDGLDAFLDEKVAAGFTIEMRTVTHAIIFRRAKGRRPFTSEDPGRFVVEVDEDGPRNDASGRAEAVLIAPRTRRRVSATDASGESTVRAGTPHDRQFSD